MLMQAWHELSASSLTFCTLMEIDLHFVLNVGRVSWSNPHLRESMGADRPFDTIIIIKQCEIIETFPYNKIYVDIYLRIVYIMGRRTSVLIRR